jgi:general secretion pathway protein I
MSRRRSQGFTLIEMMVAFAILAVALGVLYSAFENSLSRLRHDAHLQEGILLAQSVLARAGTEWPLATTRGEWDAYTYEVTQERDNPPEGQPLYTQPVVRVTAAVSWMESAGRREVTLSTLKFQPEIKP